ncbi:MAG: hypothetical protein SVR81_08240 [Chloroflexota bacterium]|nr:hypothetical protein [Chloroflexota bacterium]
MQHGAAFCIYEITRRQSPLLITADFAYIRLPGLGRARENARTLLDKVWGQ